MSENSGKSRYSPSCHLTAPPAGQHTLGRQSHTAPPSCPTRRNLQGATPGKCVSLKFRCCSISLSPAATSGRHKPLLRTFTGTIQDHLNRKINLQGNLYRGASSHEMGFCHPCPSAKSNIKKELEYLYPNSLNYFNLFNLCLTEKKPEIFKCSTKYS